MSAVLKTLDYHAIMENILFHPAWHGKIRGLDAEKKLKTFKKPYLYLLRAGEQETEYEADYYLSFILPDYSVRHQPFVITVTCEGWCFANGGSGGPYTHASIDEVIHLIMHCRQDQCVPFKK